MGAKEVLENGEKGHQNLANSHVLECDALVDLAEVQIPYSPVFQILGSKKNGSQNNSPPVRGANVDLSIHCKSF